STRSIGKGGVTMRPHALVVVLGAMGILAVCRPCHALPSFARQYGFDCQQCHSVPPRLNLFGLAFQANYFNLPPAKPAAVNPPVSKQGSGTIQLAAPAPAPSSGNLPASKEGSGTIHNAAPAAAPPRDNPPASQGGAGSPPILGRFPISGIATFSVEANRTEDKTTADFRE